MDDLTTLNLTQTVNNVNESLTKKLDNETKVRSKRTVNEFSATIVTENDVDDSDR